MECVSLICHHLAPGFTEAWCGVWAGGGEGPRRCGHRVGGTGWREGWWRGREASLSHGFEELIPLALGGILSELS